MTDIVTAVPSIIGSHGRGWKADHNAYAKKMGITPGNNAVVSSWIVEATWAHPVWHSYSISAVHLRELDDKRKTVVLPGMTHHLFVFALDPEKPRDPMISGEEKHALLMPLNFAAQFTAESDEAAASRVAKTVEEIIDGQLSPDTDFRWQWIARFGDNMLKEGRR